MKASFSRRPTTPWHRAEKRPFDVAAGIRLGSTSFPDSPPNKALWRPRGKTAFRPASFSYLIGEDGKIRGVFDNGTEHNLGQIRITLRQSDSVSNSAAKTSTAVTPACRCSAIRASKASARSSGEVEQSNTDISKSLIDLISASTQYRGNARVITAAQQLLDELLNLRR